MAAVRDTQDPRRWIPVIIGLLALLCAGPAVAQTPAPTPDPTPPPLTEASAPTAAAEGDVATVYIYRPGKYWGKALEPSVFLDEKKLLDMDNARYLALRLTPGHHVLRSNEKDSEIDQEWDAGKTYYVKMTIATGMLKGRGQMAMVTEKLARKEMQKLKPLNKENIAAELQDIVDLSPVQ